MREWEMQNHVFLYIDETTYQSEPAAPREMFTLDLLRALVSGGAVIIHVTRKSLEVFSRRIMSKFEDADVVVKTTAGPSTGYLVMRIHAPQNDPSVVKIVGLEVHKEEARAPRAQAPSPSFS